MIKLNYLFGSILICALICFSCSDKDVKQGDYVKGDLENVEPGTNLRIGESTIADLGIPTDNYSEYNGQWVNFEGFPRYAVVPDDSGGVYVAWEDAEGKFGVYISHIVPSGGSYNLAEHYRVPGLRRIGGFARDSETGQLYVMTCQRKGEEYESNSGAHGSRLTSIDAQGTLNYITRLPEKEGVKPLFSGTGRMAYQNGALLYHFAFKGPSKHQFGKYIAVNAENGVAGRSASVSHLYSQRVISDGEAFVEVVAGAARKGLTLWKSQWSNDEKIIKKPQRNIAFAGESVKIGSILSTENGYLLSFITRDYRNGFDPPENNKDRSPSRQAALVHLKRNLNDYSYGHHLDPDGYEIKVVDTQVGNPNTSSFEVDVIQGGRTVHATNRGVVWLSNFDNEEQAKRTKLVDIGSGQYMALWEHWLNEKNGFHNTWAMVIDEWGNTIKEAEPVAQVKLTPNAEAFELGGKAAWMAGESGQLVIYAVDKNYNLERIAFD